MRSRVRIVATAFVMSPVELGLGVERLRQAGFDVEIDARTFRKSALYAGSDVERASALLEAVYDEDCEVVWLARGGYGGMRLLPLLEHGTKKRGKPKKKKLLVGYSDATSLFGFARKHWGMRVLHAPMPGLSSFCKIPEASFAPLVQAVRGERWTLPWEGQRLKNIGAPAKRAVEGELVGGNLSVWATLRGTRFAESVKGKILFLEEVDEPLYRMDRDFQQVLLSGGLQGVKALVLGTFDACRDVVGSGLFAEPASEKERLRVIHAPRPEDRKPLRELIDLGQGIADTFGEVGKRLGIPVYAGLAAGHGEAGQNALPIGATMRISPRGEIECRRWAGWS